MKTSVTDSLDKHSSNIEDARARVAKLLDNLPANSITSNNIKRVSETNLLLIFRTVAVLGLRRWAPDVLSGDPDSMYNLLHEHIALTTFEQVASAYGYGFMGIDMALVRNFVLMCKFYRSFVYSYMHGIAKAESKSPGRVAKDKQMTAVWKRRSDVSFDFIEIKIFGLINSC